MWRCFLALLFCINNFIPRVTECSTLTVDPRTTEIKGYLVRNGYLTSTPISDSLGVDFEVLGQAIVDLQILLGLDPTGRVDDFLLETIRKPRCGLADVAPEEYRTTEVKYEKTRFTYRIDEFTADMNRADVSMIIGDAFKAWANVTPLMFTEVFDPTPADFKIRFIAGPHGDGVPFDGPGGVLAHAFLPLRGDAHFDDAERWTSGTFTGINLLEVAAHEFGHSLGLYHSQDINALMYPYYHGYQRTFRLGQDDIDGIRSLYGSNTDGGSGNGDVPTMTTTPPPTPTAQPPPDPEACLRDGTFDAAANTADGNSYGFIGKYVWRLDVYPRTYAEVNSVFPNLPDFVQAAVKQGVLTYIFKKCYVWRYVNRLFQGRVSIQFAFPGLPCNIGAGYHSESDGFTYFFKGMYVYQFRGSDLIATIPIHRLGWYGLPSRSFYVTAAKANYGDDGTVSNVYVFSGNRYYLFDDVTKDFLYPGVYPRRVDRSILPQCQRS